LHPFASEKVYVYAANDPVNRVDRFGAPDDEPWDGPTIETETWDQMEKNKETQAEVAGQLEDAERNMRPLKPGSGAWREGRQLRERLSERLKGLKNQLQDLKRAARHRLGGIAGAALLCFGLSERAEAAGVTPLEQFDAEGRQDFIDDIKFYLQSDRIYDFFLETFAGFRGARAGSLSRSAGSQSESE
jgi:hypothetical protein